MVYLTDVEFKNLTSFVKVNFGIDLENRKIFAEARLARVMGAKGYEKFADYFEFAVSDPTGVEISDLISNLTVNHTLFYRESYHFDILMNTVLPYLADKEKESRRLNIWSAGCSTGEEPYTLAMLLSDYFGFYAHMWDTRILATDVSTVALKKAIDGVYNIAAVENLNPVWVRNYFSFDENKPDQIGIAKKIKDQIIFRQHNLIGDAFNFKKKFHLIFCKNVMIYFDEPTKNKLIRKFYDHLEEGGYLFIGVSESIDKSASGFKYVMPSVYRKEPRL